MADYSDKTLRALIRHLITEDVPNLAIGPKANPDRRALLTTQALLILKKIFSPGGFVALATMGLIFDREHTKDLLVFGLDEFKNIVDAVTVFNDTDGDVFAKLAEASAAHGKTAKANKYKYLQSLKEDIASAEGGSLSQGVVANILGNYEAFKPGPNIDGNPVTNQDIAIYNAIVTGEIENAFDNSQFETSSTGQPLKIAGFDHSGDYDADKEKLYEAEIEKAKKAGNYINVNIIEALRKAHAAGPKIRPEQAAEQFNIAVDIYNLAESEELGDLEKVVMFKRIEEVEKNFGNGFIASIKKKATEKAEAAFTGLVNKATDIVKKRIGLSK